MGVKWCCNNESVHLCLASHCTLAQGCKQQSILPEQMGKILGGVQARHGTSRSSMWGAARSHPPPIHPHKGNNGQNRFGFPMHAPPPLPLQQPSHTCEGTGRQLHATFRPRALFSCSPRPKTHSRLIDCNMHAGQGTSPCMHESAAADFITGLQEPLSLVLHTNRPGPRAQHSQNIGWIL